MLIFNDLCFIIKQQVQQEQQQHLQLHQVKNLPCRNIFSFVEMLKEREQNN